MNKFRFFAFLLILIQGLLLLSPAALAEGIPNYQIDGAPVIDASAALLLDIESGTVLYSLNADTRIYPASLTKIMTTMLALKFGDLNDEVTASITATSGLPLDASTVDIKAGEVMTLQDLLYCVMVASANEACNVVAEYISGTIDEFVALMNQEAADLGCTSTHFTNTNGLHDDGHYTTARDLSIMTLAALQYPDFVTLCNTASKEIPATNISDPRYLKTTNYLISNNTVVGYLYTKACGVKTGYTSQAGHCLISTAQSGSMSLLSVLTGAKSVVLEDGTTQIQSFTQTAELFDFGFNSFQSVTVLKSVEMLAEVPVTMATDTERVVLSPSQSLTVLLPKNYDADLIEKQVTLLYPDGVEAPVSADDELGYVTVRYAGTELGTIPLCAITDVARSELQYYTSVVQDYLSNHLVKLIIIVVAVALVGYILIYTVHNHRRRRRNRRVR